MPTATTSFSFRRTAYETRFVLFRRDNGVFYTENTTTGKQSSLRTRDETEAKSLLNAKNEAQRQPVLNLHLDRRLIVGRAHLSALPCPNLPLPFPTSRLLINSATFMS